MFDISYSVSRCIQISAPLQQIHAHLINFRNWPQWSPWLCMDKQAKVQFSGTDGKADSAYSWQGPCVGEGQLSHENISAQHLQMRLEFYKPWQSVAQVGFDLQPIDANTTKVTWSLQATLPIYLFFMKKNMQIVIGMDYERGLNMLKDSIETGQVLSDTELIGAVNTPEQAYIGLKQSCSMADLESSMSTTFASLFEKLHAEDINITEPPFTLYHDWDIKNQRCVYSIAIPDNSDKSLHDKQLIRAIRPDFKALKITHTGQYKYLGNAWMCAYSQTQHNKQLKPDKKQAGFEVYINDPSETDSKDLICEIYFPLR